MSSQFLVVPFKSVYNYVMGIPFATTLDVIASQVHLKLKFHNLHGEKIIVNVDLEGEKRIYQALEQDQGESNTMEVDVASITNQLRSMNI